MLLLRGGIERDLSRSGRTDGIGEEGKVDKDNTRQLKLWAQGVCGLKVLEASMKFFTMFWSAIEG